VRVLLVKPPPVKNSEVENVLEPLELLSLAGALEGHEVHLCDLRVEAGPFERKLRDLAPDLVGFTCLIMDVPAVLAMSRQVREIAPAAVVVVGGHHPTHCPQDFNVPSIDAIVLGMGEQALRDILVAAGAGRDFRDVPGLALPGEGAVHFTAPRHHPASLDELPFPDRRVPGYRPERYKVFGLMKMQSVNTSRGCTARCKFCLVWQEMRRVCLHKSAGRIFAEIQRIGPEVPLVGFVDPHSFVDGADRMNELAGLIERAGLKKRYVMSLRSSSVVKYPEQIARWAKLGLSAVSIGLEAITDSRLAALRKGQNAQTGDRALRILADNGIHVIANFIVSQDFTRADFDQLQRYVYDNRLQSLRFSILTPLPGSELWEEVKHLVRSRDPEHYDLLHSVLPTLLPDREFHREVLMLYRRSYSWRHWLRVTGSHWAFRLGLSKRRVPKLLGAAMVVYMKYKLAKIQRNHVAFREAGTA